MVDYFEFPVAYNPDTDQLVKGATFQVFAVSDVSFSTPLNTFDPDSGVAILPLRSSLNTGLLPSFRVAGDPQQIVIKSGTFTTLLTSVYGRQGPAGPSAYEQAVAAGYEGTQAEFVQALADDMRLKLSGPAAETGAVFWGVFPEGSEPTPPDDGRVHWGFRTPS